MSKYARREVERRFLLVNLPTDLPEPVEIEDRYITGTTLRLRRVSGAGKTVFKLTQKVSNSPSDDWVTTIYLSEAEFELLHRLPSQPLRKLRHLMPEGWSVDVFQGELHGSILAETESGHDLSHLGPEVTRDPRYSGAWLAEHGLPTGP